MRRVRWGNVGKLAVLLALGALIATSGRGEEAEERQAGTGKQAAEPERRRSRPRRREREALRPKRERREPKAAKKGSPAGRRAERTPKSKPLVTAPAPVVPDPPQAPSAAPPQAPPAPPPSPPRTGEFTPDPAP